MSRRLWILSLCVVACGGGSGAAAPQSPAPKGSQAESSSEAAPADVPYSVAEPPRPTSGGATQDEQWWVSSTCPEGSERFGGAPPEGTEIGCRTPKGKLEGRFARFHETGKKAEEGEYENNLAVGVWTTWSPDGQKVLETSYQNGAKHGVETEWYPGGKIKSQREFKAGKRDGLTTIWDESGQKRTAMTYKDAKAYGIEVRWDETGEVAKVIEHGKN